MSKINETPTQQKKSNKLMTVVTLSVWEALSQNEIQEAFTQLKNKIKVQDPTNPNMFPYE